MSGGAPCCALVPMSSVRSLAALGPGLPRLVGGVGGNLGGVPGRALALGVGGGFSHRSGRVLGLGGWRAFAFGVAGCLGVGRALAPGVGGCRVAVGAGRAAGLGL